MPDLVFTSWWLYAVTFAVILGIIVIAAFVQLVEMVVERISMKLYYALGIFLPLITVNCAILGGSLFMVERSYDFGQSVVYGFGTGVGWAIAIVMLAPLTYRAWQRWGFASLLGLAAMASLGTRTPAPPSESFPTGCSQAKLLRA